MRKHGEYMHEKRLKFKIGLQKKFIYIIKERSGKTWGKLAKLMNISEHTLKSDLYNEKTTLPVSITKKLLRIYQIDDLDTIKRDWVDNILEKNWGQIKIGRKNIKRITEPAHSEDLAEFIGVMIGDGHVWKKGIRVTGNSKEIKHHHYVKKLIKRLFDVEATVYISYTKESTCITNVYSKNLVLFLEKNGLKKGNKIINKIKIPDWIFRKKKFAYAALRGLFDTDGGIYQKQKEYNRAFIELQNHCPETMESITKLIEFAGFSTSQSSINIRIQNQIDISKFFALVGSSNPENIIRYKNFIQTGQIPLKEELGKSIVEYNGIQPFKTRL